MRFDGCSEHQKYDADHFCLKIGCMRRTNGNRRLYDGADSSIPPNIVRCDACARIIRCTGRKAQFSYGRLVFAEDRGNARVLMQSGSIHEISSGFKMNPRGCFSRS